jgi:hypothetical protein
MLEEDPNFDLSAKKKKKKKKVSRGYSFLLGTALRDIHIRM